MKLIRFLLPIALLSALTAFSQQPSPTQPNRTNSTEQTRADKFKRGLQSAIPAVVSIHVELDTSNLMPQSSNAPLPDQARSYGSGFFINDEGVILTNAHVVQGAKSIIVRNQNGNESLAQIIGVDSVLDLAVLRTSMRSDSILTLERPVDVSVGDSVYAIGSSFGLPQSVTFGIVSALHRSISSPLQDFIQTDSAINQGNSGGPLINRDGQLVGVNTMIIGVQGGNNGVGFAIPVSLARNVAEQLIQYGQTKPGRLGVHVQNLSRDMAVALGANSVQAGVVVSDVVPGSMAQDIGLKSRDIVTKINDQAVATSAQLAATVYSLREGSTITLRVIRNNKPLTLTGKSTTVIQISPDMTRHLLDGVSVVRYEAVDKVGSTIRGLLVQNTRAESPGWLAGLMPGDVIQRIGSVKVTELSDLARVKQTQKPVLIELIRQNKMVFLVLNGQSGEVRPG